MRAAFVGLARPLWPIVLVTAFAPAALDAQAARSDAIARARALYNAGRFAEAISATGEESLTTPADRAVAMLVRGRAYLERFRETGDSSDLVVGREALRLVDVAHLTETDRTELLVGLGEALFLEGRYRAAASTFEVVLARTTALGAEAHDRVLDWWASALDRHARASAPADRAATYTVIARRMEEEAKKDPRSASAAYWLAAATRALGDPDHAWDLAIAAWVRAPMSLGRRPVLRADLDRLVLEAIIPERVRKLDPAQRDAALESYKAEWEAIKMRWR